MDLTPEALEAIFINFDLRYQAAYTAAKPFYPQVAVARQSLEQVGGFVQAMTGVTHANPR